MKESKLLRRFAGRGSQVAGAKVAGAGAPRIEVTDEVLTTIREHDIRRPIGAGVLTGGVVMGWILAGVILVVAVEAMFEAQGRLDGILIPLLGLP